MEIIYRTVDGKEFTDESCAYFHEKVITDKIRLIGYNGGEVPTTKEARAVVLVGIDSAQVLKTMANQFNDCMCGIDHGDTGVFLWDSSEHCYRRIEDNDVKALSAAFRALDEMIANAKREENETKE